MGTITTVSTLDFKSLMRRRKDDLARMVLDFCRYVPLPTRAEIQSRFSRVKWAEGLIEQLPVNHDGRNSWLLNYGRGPAAEALRKSRNLGWDDETEAAHEVR